MIVIGKYKNKFKEASHIIFEGSLNNPFFRQFAIQIIKNIKGQHIETNKKKYKIRKTKKGREFVKLNYKDIFGIVKTKGFPFKDSRE